MAIVESVGKIPLQDPPEEEFCAADLTWTKFGNSEHHDEVPFIPYDRVDVNWMVSVSVWLRMLET